MLVGDIFLHALDLLEPAEHCSNSAAYLSIVEFTVLKWSPKLTKPVQ